MRRYLNDEGYCGGFDHKELQEILGDMKSNFRSWVTGFAPRAVGADLQSRAVQEFSATFYTIRPDIALSVIKTIYQTDLRATLPLVRITTHPNHPEIKYPNCSSRILYRNRSMKLDLRVSEYCRSPKVKR